jgi:hypothetical protein
MPNEFSNFSTPDAGSSSNGRQGAPAGNVGDEGSGGYHWDPSVFNEQTQKLGKWVKDDNATAGNGSFTPTFDTAAWGGRSNDLDAQGNEVDGTSGAARDRDRFRLMGATPTNTTGPQIDQTRSDQTRNINMGALGLLQQTAEGQVPSVAERAGTKMAIDASNNLQSVGQSVRGGAMARAAGARAATQSAGLIQAQQAQANAATRANEMAVARGAYVGASTAQRGTDLEAATAQAKLDQGQNALNDQRQNANEQLGYDVQASSLSQKMGRTAAEANAAQSGHDTNVANAKQEYDRLQNNIRMGVGGAQGGFAAGEKVFGGSTTDSNGNPDPDTTSDEEAKTNVKPVKPVSDRVASRLKASAQSMLENIDAQREGQGLSTVNTPGNKSAERGEAEAPKARIRGRVRGEGFDAPNGYDHSMFKSAQDTPESLTRAIEESHARENPAGGIVRDFPEDADPRTRTLFGGGHLGYAKERAGHPGAFGGPEARYDLGGGYSDGWASSQGRPNGPSAPGTEDFRAGAGRVTDPYSRLIMGLPVGSDGKRFRMPPPVETTTMSDGKTKKEVRPLTEAEKAQDEAETKAFMAGSKPIEKEAPPSTPEEEQEARNKAAYDAREIAHLAKQDEIKRVNGEKLAWLAEQDQRALDKAAEEHAKLPKFLGNLLDRAANYVGPAHANETTEQKIARAEKWRAEQTARHARYKWGNEQGDKVIPESLQRYTSPKPRSPVAFSREEREIPAERAPENVTFSDIHAKRQAFKEGMNHAQTMQDTGEVPPTPMYMRDPEEERKKSAALAADMKRAAAAEAAVAAKQDEYVTRQHPVPKTDPRGRDLVVQGAWTDTVGRGKASPAQKAAIQAADKAAAAKEQADAVVFSDEKTKERFGKSGADRMAQANRSMAPYEYEYKEGFAEREGQKLGDKNVGPIAQNMKADPVARTAIVTDPETGLLGIDKSKGLKLVMGGLADAQRQIDELRKQKGRRA